MKLHKLPDEVRSMSFADFLTMINCDTIIEPPPDKHG